MRTPLTILALVGFSGWLSDPEEREDSGPAGDPRRYGRVVLLPEDSALPDVSDASNVIFLEPLERDSCGSADAEDVSAKVRIDGVHGPGASWSLEPSRDFGRSRP